MTDESNKPRRTEEDGDESEQDAELGSMLRRSQSRIQGNKIPDMDAGDLEHSSVSGDEHSHETQTDQLTQPTRARSQQSALPRKLGEKVDRDVRQLLRRIQDHLLTSQVALGATHNTVGLTEVVYHEGNRLGTLNYVMPRRRTAWVSASQIQHGIDFLAEQGRTPRLLFVEGLYPPMFARALDSLDLHIESEMPLMIYEHTSGISPSEPDDPVGFQVRIEQVQDVRGMEVWWYVWRNAHYDTYALGVEPIYVGRDMAAVAMGHQIDIIAYQESFPCAVARVTVNEDTAHIVGLAVFQEMSSPELIRLLTYHALCAALDVGCEIVFMPGNTVDDRDLLRSLGFMDFGSIVCYAAKSEKSPTSAEENVKLEQPILEIRFKSGGAESK